MWHVPDRTLTGLKATSHEIRLGEKVESARVHGRIQPCANGICADARAR